MRAIPLPAAAEQYVWDPRYIDAPVLRQRDTDSDGSPDETLYYTTDALFNVTALIDASSGLVIERYTYSPYGQVTVLDAVGSVDADGVSDVANALGFQGTFRDAETGLHHVRHRMYHPTLGIWATRDPLIYVDGMNVYERTMSSPVNLTDSSGTRVDSVQRGKYTLLHVYRPSRNILAWLRHGAEEYAGTIVYRTPHDATQNDVTDQILRRTAHALASGATLRTIARGIETAAACAEIAIRVASPVVDTILATEEFLRDPSAMSILALVPFVPGGASFGSRAIITTKIAKQMRQRGWTEELVAEAMKSGQQIPAINKKTGNPAIRYMHPQTGQSVVVDTVTNEVIHVGGPGFVYGPSSGDLP